MARNRSSERRKHHRVATVSVAALGEEQPSWGRVSHGRNSGIAAVSCLSVRPLLLVKSGGRR